MSHTVQLHHRGSLADSRQIMHGSVLPGNVHNAGYRQGQARALATAVMEFDPVPSHAYNASHHGVGPARRIAC